MDPPLSLVIHEILPTEILKIIFEEHAMLEWKAPTIDGRVCRLWRRIVLNTPRAWAYLTIRKYYAPSVGELRLWLHQRLSTLIPARQDGTPVRSCTIYLETTTQESHLCERGTAPSPSSKGEIFHACDF